MVSMRLNRESLEGHQALFIIDFDGQVDSEDSLDQIMDEIGQNVDGTVRIHATSKRNSLSKDF